MIGIRNKFSFLILLVSIAGSAIESTVARFSTMLQSKFYISASLFILCLIDCVGYRQWQFIINRFYFKIICLKI